MSAVCIWCGTKGGFANFLIIREDLVECEWCAANARVEAKKVEQWN